jgi:hypothetical protein
MFTHLVQQLSRLLPPATPRAAAPAADDGPERGWHESSWVLAHGADVIELPAPLAASWFPDTQPSFHGPSEDTPLAA